MTSYPHLFKRANSTSFYFRSIVPKALQSTLSQKEFQLSLRTGLHKEAKKISRALSVKINYIYQKMNKQNEKNQFTKEDIKKYS